MSDCCLWADLLGNRMGFARLAEDVIRSWRGKKPGESLGPFDKILSATIGKRIPSAERGAVLMLRRRHTGDVESAHRGCTGGDAVHGQVDNDFGRQARETHYR